MSDKDLTVAIEYQLARYSSKAEKMARKAASTFDPNSYETISSFGANIHDMESSKIDTRMFQGGTILRAEYQTTQGEPGVVWFVIAETDGVNFLFFIKPKDKVSNDWAESPKKFILIPASTETKTARIIDVVSIFAGIEGTTTSRVDVVSKGLAGKKGRELWWIPRPTNTPLPQERTNEK